ncbi:MAG: hypothetical protein ACJ75J_12535 [Cytophagaceae bacterium]
MSDENTLEKYNKLNTILFYALFGGQIVFLAITSYLLQSGPKNPNLASSFQSVLPALTIASVLGAFFLPKILLGSVADMPEEVKLQKYRVSLLVKWALLEGSNIFSIVVYLMTGSVLALGISMLLLILFVLNKPSLDRTKTDLDL